MNEASSGTAAAGPKHRAVEIGVTVATGVFAAITLYGSIEAGVGWASDGPQAGFFPFYIGCFILIASIVNFTNAVRDSSRRGLFAEWGQLRRVASVVVPTGVYVYLVSTIGIYVSSALLIAFFMKWLGRYQWWLVLAISVGVPVITFAVFEKWFLVPLPKGPVEQWLGL